MANSSGGGGPTAADGIAVLLEGPFGPAAMFTLLAALIGGGLVWLGMQLQLQVTGFIPVVALASVIAFNRFHMKPKNRKVTDLEAQQMDWGETSVEEIDDQAKFWTRVVQGLGIAMVLGLLFATIRAEADPQMRIAAFVLAALVGVARLPVLPEFLDLFVTRFLLKAVKSKDIASFGRKMFDSVERLFANHKSPDYRGDLKAVAERVFPLKQFPEMHVEMAADVVRPLIWDGKLFTGHDKTILAHRKVSLEAIRMAYSAAFKRVSMGLSISLSIVPFVVLTALVSVVWNIKGHDAGAYVGQRFSSASERDHEASQQQQLQDMYARIGGSDATNGPAPAVRTNRYPSRNPMAPNAAAPATQQFASGLSDDIRIAVSKQDVFSTEEATKVASAYRDANKPSTGGWYKAVNWVASGAATALFVPLVALALLAGLVSIAMRTVLAGRNPASLFDAVMNSDVSLLMDTKDAIVTRDYRLEVHARELRSWRNQIAASNRDKFPLVQVGEGTGTFLFRGLLSGYMPHQPVKLSLDDITRGGVVIFGATGAGKSYSLGKPIMNGIFNSPKLGYSLSAFVLDGKAVLWRDAEELAKAAGWKVRIIGCGIGEFGVDMFDGIEPHIVAAALNELMNQQSSSTDAFWSNMACQIIDACARIAYVAELTDYALNYAKQTGERLYSPVGVYDLCSSVGVDEPDGPLAKAIMAILDQADGDNYAVVAQYMTPDLWAAIRYVRVTVPSYGEKTTGGFMANINLVLKGFVSMQDVRERFGSARGDIIDVDRIWDDRTVTALRMSDFKYGEYARVVSVLLKIRVYHRAAVRMEEDPAIAEKSKLVLIFDEFQRLVGANGAYSEPSVLSISRAMGLGFVCMLQTIAGLRMYLGNDKTENLMGQFRTKIFLSAEDAATSSYIQQLAGTTKRSMTYTESTYESWWSQSLKTKGTMTDEVDADELTEDDALMLTDVTKSGQPKRVMARKIDFGFSTSASETVTSTEGLASGLIRRTVSAVAHMGGMTNDAVAKARSDLSQGNEDKALVTVSDVNSLGQGQAIVIINREASPRMDIIELMPELGYIRAADTVSANDAPVAAAGPGAAQRIEQRRAAATVETERLYG